MKTLKTLLTGLLVMHCICLNAQVRPNINSFNSTERGILNNLILDYLNSDLEIISTHACPGSPNFPGLHNGTSEGRLNFLPFHRAYVRDLEDFLMLNGGEDFVPLPKWDPANAIPSELLGIATSACASISCSGGNCTNVAGPNGNTGSNPARARPSHLQQPDLCNITSLNGVHFDGSSNWHNSVHNDIGGFPQPGNMASIKSPASVIFWLWHAYVDDIWTEWQCECENDPDIAGKYDIFISDSRQTRAWPMGMDMGDEKNENTLWNRPPGGKNDEFWASFDIWNKRFDTQPIDDMHEDPMSDLPNYLHIRIRNRGCLASPAIGSFPNDPHLQPRLKAYYSEYSTGIDWPVHWTTGDGGEITASTPGGIQIPSIPPCGSEIITLSWTPPTVEDAVHYCLLARVETDNDDLGKNFGMTHGEGRHTWWNTYLNNQIAWKNVDIIPCSPCKKGGTIVRNTEPEGSTQTIKLEFISPQGLDIFESGSVTVDIGEELYTSWNTGGKLGYGIDEIIGSNKIKITEPDAWIDNIELQFEMKTFIEIDFSDIELNDTIKEYYLYVIQYEGSDTIPQGGMTYILLNDESESESIAMSVPNTHTFQAVTESMLVIIPNPARHTIKLKLKDDNTMLNSFAILDFSGKIVLSGELNSHHEIDISKLNPGLYLVRSLDDNKRIHYQKLIIY